MAARQSTLRKPKSQPKIRITSYPDGYERLMELAEKRGYSRKALTALLLSAVVARAASRSRKRKAVCRG